MIKKTLTTKEIISDAILFPNQYGIIQLLPDTTYVVTEPLVLPENTKLIGSVGSIITTPMGSDFFAVVMSNNTEIRDVIIQYGSNAIANHIVGCLKIEQCNNVKIIDSKFFGSQNAQGTNLTCAFIHKTKNLIVKNSEFAYADSWGVGLYGRTRHTLFENCYMHDNGVDGLKYTTLDGARSQTNNSFNHHSRVVGGRYNNNGKRILGDGIDTCDGARNVVIDSIEASKNNGNGITIKCSGPQRIIVRSCELHNNTSNGINAQTAGVGGHKNQYIYGVVIRDNNIHHNSDNGVNTRFGDALVEGNCINNNNIGLSIFHLRNIVKNNFVYANKYNLVLDGKGHIIRDNRFLGIDVTEASVDDDLSTLPVKTDVGYSAYPYTEAVLSGNEFKYNKSLTNSPNREGLIWESNFPEIIFSWRPEGQDEDYGLGTKVKANGKIWSWVKEDGRSYEQRQEQGFLEKTQRGIVFWAEVI